MTTNRLAGTPALFRVARVWGLAVGVCSAPPLAASDPEPTVALQSLIPKPESVRPGAGAFKLSARTRVYVEPGTEELKTIGQFLADRLSRTTGFRVGVSAAKGLPPKGSIHLTTAGGDPGLGDEGYVLAVTPDRTSLSAYRPAGLFRGLQTIRQLLPPEIEGSTVQKTPWKIAAATIKDRPRFAWRGAMLDVARHFFGVGDVKRFIDLIAYYKMNRLHLHLSDDQGWRIAVDAWPALTTVGGSTQVGGGTGAYYYTKAQYSEIVAYAQARYITVVPEIDLPGHTNAALASHAELNCNDVAPPLYTGIEVGFSSLCLKKELTLSFVKDVVREISALTPGPYFHVGGDEAQSTDPAEYVRFMEDAQAIVAAQGKRTIGWEEFATVRLLPTSIVQQWDRGVAQQAVPQGAKIIMSPSKKVYLDMKYDRSTALGQDWAALIEARDAYEWDPATWVAGISEGDVLGVEAPLWTETIQTMADVEYMTLPRLAGIAEIGWSPSTDRKWDEYKNRLAAHGTRLKAMGVNFYPSPQVPWK